MMLTFEQFVIKYKVVKDKEKFIKEHIKDIHIPYSEKLVICQNIINNTSHIGEVYKVNTPARNMFFNLTLIDRYTDIKIDFTNAVEIYNKFDELDFISLVMNHIPEKELIDFDTIYHMVINDEYENNRTIVSFLETKVKALEITLNSLIEVFESVASKGGNDNEIHSIQ